MKFASGSQLTDANNAAETINDNSGAIRAEKGGWTKRHIISTVRAFAPLAAFVVMASIAHAAPTIDMSGVTSVMQTVETACLLIGAIIVLISLVFSSSRLQAGTSCAGSQVWPAFCSAAWSSGWVPRGSHR